MVRLHKIERKGGAFEAFIEVDGKVLKRPLAISADPPEGGRGDWLLEAGAGLRTSAADVGYEWSPGERDMLSNTLVTIADLMAQPRE